MKKQLCNYKLFGFIVFSLSILLGEVNAQSFERVENVVGLGILQENNGAAVADYDGDNDLDIFVVAKSIDNPESPKTLSKLFRNNNDGSFTDVTELAGLNNFLSEEEGGDIYLGLNGNKSAASWGDYNNDGFYDLVDVRIPQGTLLKPNYPAALSGRTHALGRIFDVLGALLGMGAPNEMLNAAGFSDSPHLFFSGYDDKGDWFQLFQIGFGGVPGRPIGDGPDGHSLWPSFTNVPNEFVEAYFPLRVETYEFIVDSGGAGLHRGGNGLSVAYRFLVDGHIGIHDDR